MVEVGGKEQWVAHGMVQERWVAPTPNGTGVVGGTGMVDNIYVVDQTGMVYGRSDRAGTLL